MFIGFALLYMLVLAFALMVLLGTGTVLRRALFAGAASVCSFFGSFALVNGLFCLWAYSEEGGPFFLWFATVAFVLFLASGGIVAVVVSFGKIVPPRRFLIAWGISFLVGTGLLVSLSSSPSNNWW